MPRSGWPRSFAARGPQGVVREDNSSKALADRPGGIQASPNQWADPDVTARAGASACRMLGGVNGIARRGSSAHARSRSQPELGNLCSAAWGRVSGVGPRVSHPYAPRLRARLAATRAAHRQCSLAYQRSVPGTSPVPPIGMQRLRFPARGWQNPRNRPPIQRIRFDRGYEPRTTSSRQCDPAAARALAICGSSRCPWASTKNV